MGIFDKIKDKNKIKKIKQFEEAYDKIILSIDNDEIYSSERWKILSQFEADLNNLNNELQSNSSLLEQAAITGKEIRNKIENAFTLLTNRQYQAIVKKYEYGVNMDSMDMISNGLKNLDNLPGYKKATGMVGKAATDIAREANSKYGYTYVPRNSNNDDDLSESPSRHKR